MGKFFNENVRRNNGGFLRLIIISLGIIFIIILFVLIAKRNNKQNKAILKVKDEVEVEVNSSWPDKYDYFEEFDNYDINKITIDYNGADITKIGSYQIKISTAEGGSGNIMLKVVDKTAPVLSLKPVTINYGETYKIEDFIQSCLDNSGETCTYEYDLSQNYASFTDAGTYNIYIKAKDASGNMTEFEQTILTITNGGSIGDDQQNQNPTPDNTTCEYGDLKVTEARYNYPISVIVGNEKTGCAVNRDYWDNTSIQEPVNKFYQKDYNKLKNDMKDALEKNYPNGARIVAEPHFNTVLNDSLKGIVGYGIEVKIYVADASSTGNIDVEDNLVLHYFLEKDGSRKYKVNKYDLK